MNIIAAVDNNWAIGRDGHLLVSIPNDMKLFRQETEGKVIILGRKTLATFPGKRPLENRKNIILSEDRELQVKDALVLNSVEEVLNEVKKYRSEDVYVVGGASIYEQFLPYCDVAHITKIDFEYFADRHMPNLDRDGEWKITEESDEQTYFDLCYTFTKYERITEK
ncbi:MAG: dihydrofolate reductase [Lachnospiraceae bacterium]|nr:dihydrofolate reductase [Lachnospiraceae bacterium]MEE0959849.1 dihydrofolate reductase [Lachnospiraceae bacterium]